MVSTAMAHRLRSTSLAFVVVTFAAWFCVLAYCDVVRPEPYGYAATFRGGRLVITSMDANRESPAVRAGLHPGDVLLATNGRRINDRNDWAVIEATLGFGVPLRLTIQRGSDVLERALVLARARWPFWATAPGVVLLTTLTVQFVGLILGAAIVARRRTDPVALLGAWALLTVGAYVIAFPYRFTAVWRELPAPLSGLLWLPFACGQAAAAVLGTFFVSFPRRTIRSPLLWVALWTPMAIALIAPVHDVWLLVYRAADAVQPTIQQVPFGLTAGYLLTGLGMLVWNYCHLTDANERRRVRIVVIGAAASLAPGLSVIALGALRSKSAVTASIFTSPLMIAGTLTLLVFPVSLTYAILRHRVFDIRLMVRQGLIRFGGHLSKGGYDVHSDARHSQEPAIAPAIR
jgi:multisubunit Na+/H+ antiporter MnhE subunit